MGMNVSRNARPIVLHAEFQRQRDPLAGTGDREAYSWSVGRAQGDFAARLVIECLAGVLDQVEKHLHQLVPVAVDRWQGGIVVLGYLDFAGEPGLRDCFYVIQDGVNIYRSTIDWSLVREDLHPVDKRNNPIGFISDQLRQSPVVIIYRRLEKLRGTTYSGQWIFDFVGQHGRQSRYRTGRGAMRQLPVDLVGHGAFLEQHNDGARLIRHRSDIEIDKADRYPVWASSHRHGIR